MATGGSDAKWNEQTTCAICIDDCTSGKSLPCQHTFCLKCLEDYCNGKSADDLVCPVCRSRFEVPDGGLVELPDNRYVERVMEMKRHSMVLELCEVCVEEAEGGEDRTAAMEIPTATMFCVDCNQKLCNRCGRWHSRMKTGAHEVKPLGIRGANVCSDHDGEALNMYCFDCELEMCFTCQISGHEKHNCGEISKIITEFNDRVATEIGPRIADIGRQASRLEDSKREFLEEIRKVEIEIGMKAEKLKRLIGENARSLLEELQTVKSQTMKQIWNHQDTVEIARFSVESFKKHCSELTAKGKVSEIARMAFSLRVRMAELLRTAESVEKYTTPRISLGAECNEKALFGGPNLIGYLQTGDDGMMKGVNSKDAEREDRARVELVDVSKETSTSEDFQRHNMEMSEKMKNLEKELEILKKNEEQLKEDLHQATEKVLKRIILQQVKAIDPHLLQQVNSDAEIVHKLSMPGEVRGVAVLDDKLFVLYYKSGSSEVAEYYKSTFTLNRTICQSSFEFVEKKFLRSTRLTDCFDIAAVGDTLYISDPSQKMIFVHFYLSGSQRGWLLIDKPFGISITSTRNILVACAEARKLVVLDAKGKQIREISLPSSCAIPSHVVELLPGIFTVCHNSVGDPICRVSMIGLDGKIIYENAPATVEMLKGASHLAVDTRNKAFSFVADYRSRRVVLVNFMLSSARVVLSSKDELTHDVRRLCFDDHKCVLYVAGGECVSAVRFAEKPDQS